MSTRSIEISIWRYRFIIHGTASSSVCRILCGFPHRFWILTVRKTDLTSLSSWIMSKLIVWDALAEPVSCKFASSRPRVSRATSILQTAPHYSAISHQLLDRRPALPVLHDCTVSWLARHGTAVALEPRRLWMWWLGRGRLSAFFLHRSVPSLPTSTFLHGFRDV